MSNNNAIVQLFLLKNIELSFKEKLANSFHFIFIF